MKIQANFVKDGKWWVAWTDDVPGALTQGATLKEARENLADAVRMIREPIDLSKLPKSKVVIEQLELFTHVAFAATGTPPHRGPSKAGWA
jgi:predicted RNase H-like HicB family nuclease